MPHLDVRLLGPLEIRVGGAPVAIPRGNTATVLAILLDEANSVVPLENIVRAVYGVDIPQDPETQVQNTIGVLRRKLGAARDRVETVGRAYRFTIGIEELDTLRCKGNEDRARTLRREGRLDEAVAALRDALGEWRGPALANLSGATVDSMRRRYDEHRLALLDRRIALDLELGRAAEVVDELRQIVAVHGTRQRFTALLMRALHLSGRTTEALEAFAALKERLADELGADPDPVLRDLNAAILREVPPATGAGAPLLAPEPPFPRRVPAMLPRANTRFTGRTDQMRVLDGLLDAAAGTAGLAVIAGMGGVGKTALAVSWAHRVAHRFPDGVLYFNLRGFDPLAPGADPNTVLGEALVALGVEAHLLPAGFDERIGLYRTVLAGRSVLVVLDNARDAAQVRPLLPVAPGSFTLVTSRDRLTGLDATEGADIVPLDLLSDSEGWALLVRRIGMDRAMNEERAVLRIAASCGRLPLALTLIGAWAAAHPQLPLSSLADRLDTTTNVFRVLSSSDPASDPRSVFACSYQALGSRAARAFRLFGLHPGPDLTVTAMASMMQVAPGDAEAALHELADMHLADQQREGRFTMHDLLRSYAKERFNEEVGEEQQTAAARRMIEHYLFTARIAEATASARSGHSDLFDLGEPAPGVVLEPIRDTGAASAWLDAEDEVLRGIVDLEPDRGDLHARVWQLRWALTESIVYRFASRGRPEARTAAIAATERAGNTLDLLVSGSSLTGPMLLVSTESALHEQLASVFEEAARGHSPGAKALVSYTLTVGTGVEDCDEAARGYAAQGYQYFVDHGNQFWANRMQYAIGWHSARLGEFGEARACFERVVRDAVPERRPLAKANTDLGFGYVAHSEGDYRTAIGHFTEALVWYQANDLEVSAAFARDNLGDARAALGEPAAARSEWEAAATAYEAFGLLAEAARVRAKAAPAPAVDIASGDSAR
ncbi:AfsR/SARP family transcriptional regulator [Glycomyces algeriensis]|uniref:SARP family transcriptional regulator n=1 Tax=Glycomyces algeriensis TaxID=256037 RepID=A0A9W6G5B7_9ACTN|nr:BTAD domain-containing putative transcriptional regulator [Glycomyces algeriensis]MDA1366313.1 BTAD domain-containing putative transcriptional regulator [Glycomyces algeriensis]MDR7348658.1 DNA-binding SARP family transcriptional activator [Glycomyces algeriensis]GLI41360.1 SARP family transcriptional regulator [Glycomyces algeriensis]